MRGGKKEIVKIEVIEMRKSLIPIIICLGIIPCILWASPSETKQIAPKVALEKSISVDFYESPQNDTLMLRRADGTTYKMKGEVESYESGKFVTSLALGGKMSFPLRQVQTIVFSGTSSKKVTFGDTLILRKDDGSTYTLNARIKRYGDNKFAVVSSSGEEATFSTNQVQAIEFEVSKKEETAERRSVEMPEQKAPSRKTEMERKAEGRTRDTTHEYTEAKDKYPKKDVKPADLMPPFSRQLKGRDEVRVRNPNSFGVTVCVRSGKLGDKYIKGKNFKVSANGKASVFVPDGRYDIYFVYSNQPDALYQGDSFTLQGNGVEIQIVEVIDGNYNINRVK